MSFRFFFYGILLGTTILALTMPIALRKTEPQQTTATIDASYFANKGTGAVVRTSSFAALSERFAAVTQAVLGIETSPTPEPARESTQTNTSVTGSYTIAVLGDSMVATLGPEVSILKNELKKRYPKANFAVHNAGAASTNIEYGLYRLTNSYSYMGEQKPSVLSLQPDILVLESFAYNHWSDQQSDLDRQWLTIDKIIQTTRNNSAKTKIILSATIAPHCPTYTDGSANLPPERKFVQCNTVKKYLQNMINFATSQKYPLADAYHPSLDGNNEGQKKYIAGDNIHPSGPGGELYARKVADQIEHVLSP